MHQKLCALKGVLRAVSRLEESIQKTHRITLTEALCLCSINLGFTCASNLEKEVSLSPSRLSRVLSSLESKELIERIRDEKDKRTWNLSPSKKGQALLARMKDTEFEIPAELNKILNSEG